MKDMPDESDQVLAPPFNAEHLSKPRLIDRVREVIRCKHYSIRTERAYIDWIRRYIFFHDKQHPELLAESHINAFLTYLAVKRKVAASTQNQALCALVFLYREVLKKELGEFGDIIRAKKPQKFTSGVYPGRGQAGVVAPGRG